jgi:integrase/recombinase XerD
MTGLPALPIPMRDERATTRSVIEQLAQIPEEGIWLAKQKSARTRRAYRLDVHHFMATVGITSLDQLRQADHRAVIAWERHMREREDAAPSTIRRRMSALSSLFKHLVRRVDANRERTPGATRIRRLQRIGEARSMPRVRPCDFGPDSGELGPEHEDPP